MRRRLFVLPIALLSCASLIQKQVWAQQPRQFTFHQVVATGDMLAPEVPFSQFGTAAINNGGQVAFIAGGGSGLYLRSANTTTALALTGERVPGDEELFIGEITDLALNNRSDVLFVASVFGQDDRLGVFLLPGGAGPIEPIIFSGEVVPGPVFARFQRFRDLQINDRGDIAFTGIFRNTQSGAFLFSRGALELIAIANQDAPGTGGGQFTRADMRSLANDGAVLLEAGVRNSDVREGIFMRRDGDLQAVVLTGQTAPGTGGGRFTSLDHPAFTDQDGDFAFFGFALGGTAFGGIFLMTDGEIEPVIFGGQPVPAAGRRSIVEFAPIATNFQGEFAFRAMLEEQEEGVFFFSGGQLDLVVFSDRTVGDSFARRFIPAGSTSLNAAGTIAFVGETATPTTTGVYLVTGGELTSAVTSQQSVPADRRVRLARSVGLNNVGGVVFSGLVAGNGGGLYLAQGGQVSALVVSGQGTPETNGGLTRDLDEVKADRHDVTDQGQVAVNVSLTGGDTGRGIFRASAGMLAPVALAEESAAGISGTTFLNFDQLATNNSGGVAFSCILDRRNDVKEAIVLFSEGNNRLIAEQEQPAPGTDGSEFFALRGQTLAVNDQRDVVFVAELDDSRQGVFLFSAGDLKIVALGGQEAPGSGGAAFEAFGNVSINEPGMVAFDCEFDDGGGGVYLFDDGQLRPLAVSGDEVPGVEGRSFRSFGRAAINRAGEVAFFALWGFFGEQGILLFSNEMLTPVVVAEQQLGDGRQFSGFFGLSLNDGSEIAFAAALDGSSLPSAVFLATPAAAGNY